MTGSDAIGTQEGINRRRFIQSVLATGAGLALVRPTWASTDEKPADQVNIALIGAGSQGRHLMMNALKIPGVRFKAVADVWDYSLRYATNILARYDQPVNGYSDYRDLLSQEKDLDAVIIATPDWVHAEQTIASLKAGLHVYCEKEMSNTIEEARQMVLASRETGKLLQIGHQRRSNPRYQHALKLINRERILGRITHFEGQWNRSRRLEVGWPSNQEIDKARLNELGFEDMFQFRNWRWFRKYSGGAMADLGSHQVDVFNWYLDTPPSAVLAAGGNDYYERSEWYDHVMAIYEYPGEHGTIRGMYKVLNTTSHGGFYELVMGDAGTLAISEDKSKGYVVRERESRERVWEDQANRVEGMDQRAIELQVGATFKATDPAKMEELAAEADKPPHQLHLENFFNTLRDPKNHQLTCPGEVGFETAVTVLKANEAVETGARLMMDPAWFKV